MGSDDSWHLATYRSTTLSCSHARRCARRARELSSFCTTLTTTGKRFDSSPKKKSKKKSKEQKNQRKKKEKEKKKKKREASKGYLPETALKKQIQRNVTINRAAIEAKKMKKKWTLKVALHPSGVLLVVLLFCSVSFLARTGQKKVALEKHRSQHLARPGATHRISRSKTSQSG